MARKKKDAELEITWKDAATCPVKFIDDAFGANGAALAETLRALTGREHPRLMLVADGNVVQHSDGLGTRIGRWVQEHGIDLAGRPVVICCGEKVKSDNMACALKVMQAMLEAKVGRGDVVLALGGGTLLDVAGYAAAQVRGGIRLVRMPTTVASIVDGAFAETAALDAGTIKDAYRVRCLPAAVVIDYAFALTVLDGVWRGGIGEVIRYAAVTDAALMKRLAASARQLYGRDAKLMGELVRACVERRVAKGPTDFALWSAMRMEAMSGYKLPHGYAVPIGICIDCTYAMMRGLMKPEDRDLVCGTLVECGALDGLVHSQHLLTQVEGVLFGLDSMRLATGSDSVVLPDGIGRSQVEEKPDREIYRRVVSDFLRMAAAGSVPKEQPKDAAASPQRETEGK